MEHRADISPPAVGRTIAFLPAKTGTSLTWGPIWAALCGALASNGRLWPGEQLLTLLMVFFLVEGLWNTWRALLVDIDWRALATTYPLPDGGRMPVLPYLTPWSPLGRIIDGWERLRRWAREILPPAYGNALTTMPYLPVLILTLSILLGRVFLILSVLVIALVTLEWIVARRQTWHKSLQAIVQLASSWIAGHLVFAPLAAPSLTLACAYALGYQGALYLNDERCTAGQYPWALSLLFGGQVLAAGIVALQGPTLVAIVLGLLLAPQLLLLPQLAPDTAQTHYLRPIAPIVGLSMLLAAWTV